MAGRNDLQTDAVQNRQGANRPFVAASVARRLTGSPSHSEWLEPSVGRAHSFGGSYLLRVAAGTPGFG
jgi:hypothetical protein